VDQEISGIAEVRLPQNLLSWNSQVMNSVMWRLSLRMLPSAVNTHGNNGYKFNYTLK
jgi:hypothetical protein